MSHTDVKVGSFYYFRDNYDEVLLKAVKSFSYSEARAIDNSYTAHNSRANFKEVTRKELPLYLGWFYINPELSELLC
jgi:hypothetical protein